MACSSVTVLGRPGNGGDRTPCPGAPPEQSWDTIKGMGGDGVQDVFRRWGYLQAGLDPLGRLEPMPHPDLEAACGDEAARLRATYCGPIGVEFMHMPQAERCRFVAERMEAPPAAPDRRRI